MIVPRHPAWPRWEGSSPLLCELAARALACAAWQPDASVDALARTMYDYNRLPATRERLICWEGADAVQASVARLIPRGSYESAGATPGWLHWRSRIRRRARGGRLKFYVSPHPDALRDALAAVLPVFARHDSPAFKLASDAYGLLRPDKVVVYLHERIDPDGMARELTRCLAGCRVQGVPFTAALGAEGAVSWGIDPPGSGARRSWRLWIVSQLADAIAAARRQPRSGEDPDASARLRLGRAGVDISRWAPTPDLARELLDRTA